ncbi:MAG: protein translocase subunit SecF, partial [Acidobacteriota bacterium]|nr:protein translocase subunit SecF [Acidobacteriota bacterium]
MGIFDNSNFDFIKWRWHAIALSTLIVLGGIGFVVMRGLPLGIDFSGGTIVVVKFEQPITVDQVRSALAAGMSGENVIQSYGDEANNEILIRVPQLVQEEGAALEQNARAIVDSITKANLGGFEVRSQEIVGPVIGADLQRKGIYATLASLFGITIYIGLRFRFAFALGAIAATLHDVLVTFAFLAFFGYDLSLNVVAAILAITGYSVNDTIVIFDRVRENLKSKRRD